MSATKFQIDEEILSRHPEWDEEDLGRWAVYAPVSKVYYFYDTPEQADTAIALFNDISKTLKETKNG